MRRAARVRLWSWLVILLVLAILYIIYRSQPRLAYLDDDGVFHETRAGYTIQIPHGWKMVEAEGLAARFEGYDFDGYYSSPSPYVITISKPVDRGDQRLDKAGTEHLNGIWESVFTDQSGWTKLDGRDVWWTETWIEFSGDEIRGMAYCIADGDRMIVITCQATPVNFNNASRDLMRQAIFTFRGSD